MASSDRMTKHIGKGKWWSEGKDRMDCGWWSWEAESEVTSRYQLSVSWYQWWEGRGHSPSPVGWCVSQVTWGYVSRVVVRAEISKVKPDSRGIWVLRDETSVEMLVQCSTGTWLKSSVMRLRRNYSQRIILVGELYHWKSMIVSLSIWCDKTGMK